MSVYMPILPKNIKKYVIPALLTHSKGEFLRDIQMVKNARPKAKLVQLDVCDGKFVDNTTWGTPNQVKNLDIQMSFEVHLMVKNPEKAYKQWIEAGASRVVFHQEATKDPMSLAKAIKAAGAKPIIALNPDTSIVLEPLILKEIYGILMMGVHPGFGGQPMVGGTIQRVRTLRKKHPRLRIGVDGGVNAKNAQKLLDAGATELIMGSGFFKNNFSKN